MREQANPRRNGTCGGCAVTAQVLFSLTKDSMAEWLVLQMQGLSFLNQDSRDDRRSDICRQPANLHCACKCREEWSALTVPDYLDFCP